MKRYTARIEFGTPSFKDVIKEELLVGMTLTGYDTESVIRFFEHKIFQDECHKAVGKYSTFGIHRVINLASPKTLARVAERADKESEATFYECTDHDGHADYFIRVKVTTESKRAILAEMGVNEIPETWWRFGRATFDGNLGTRLIIQDGNYWYHMFGKFYWNTGKRK